jgi:hypothetical protein
VRFPSATRLIVGFQRESDARRFWDAMRNRLQEFSLSLHPDKTRLIEFGRFAVQNHERRGLGKPEIFKFLGFVLVCEKSRRGDFQIWRKSRRDRMRAKLREVKEELRRRMHKPIPETGTWLAQVVASPITPYRLIAGRWQRSDTMSSSSGTDSYVDVARECGWCGSGWRNWPTSFCPSHGSCILGRACGLPSGTRGRSPVPESGSLGPARGALRNGRPYRETSAAWCLSATR